MLRRLGSLALLSAVAAVLLFVCCFAGGADAAEKEIPKTRLGSGATGGVHQLPTGGPTLTILYCYQCGYRKAFDDYSNILQQNYPQLVILGDNYNPQNLSYYLSKLITVVKFALIACIFSATNIWGYFGQVTPAWFTWCQTNKLYACMMFYFVGNMLEGQLISSGAFEIQLNDIPIWSKIETGRVPAPQELFQILDSYLKLETKVPDFEV